jgi:hypothetical protein
MRIVNAVEMKMRRSIIDKSGWYPSLHRFIYAHGWAGSCAFATAALAAFLFSFWSGVILAMVAVAFLVLSAATEFMEGLMKELKHRVRLNEFRHGPDYYEED